MNTKTPAKSEAFYEPTLVASMSANEMRAHMARVETLCNVVEMLVQSMASNPLMSAMIPPEIKAKFTSAGS